MNATVQFSMKPSDSTFITWYVQANKSNLQWSPQGSKNVSSGRPGQVDFCVGQVIFPTNLPNGQGYGQAARELSWNNNL